MVHAVYEEEGIILIAAQVDGKVLVAPFTELQVITRKTVIFCLAQDEAALAPIRLNKSGSAEWRQVFADNRRHHNIDEEMQNTRTHRFIHNKNARRAMVCLWERPMPMVQRLGASETYSTPPR
eukprot:SRR837773.6151.p1 GENE.SRR837773.6151~~SRR837773.6151.p1  ORF type:complete len:136 (+),score=34.06 SRR837773.6151:42-410(+)